MERSTLVERSDFESAELQMKQRPFALSGFLGLPIMILGSMLITLPLEAARAWGMVAPSTLDKLDTLGGLSVVGFLVCSALLMVLALQYERVVRLRLSPTSLHVHGGAGWLGVPRKVTLPLHQFRPRWLAETTGGTKGMTPSLKLESDQRTLVIPHLYVSTDDKRRIVQIIEDASRRAPAGGEELVPEGLRPARVDAMKGRQRE